MKNIWIFNNAGNSCGVFIFFFWKWARICHYWFYFCKNVVFSVVGNQTCIDFLKLNTTAFFFLSCSFLFISLRLFCCALKRLSQHFSDETIKCRCWHSIRGRAESKTVFCWTLSHCIHLGWGGGDTTVYICTLNAFPDLFSKLRMWSQNLKSFLATQLLIYGNRKPAKD